MIDEAIRYSEAIEKLGIVAIQSLIIMGLLSVIVVGAKYWRADVAGFAEVVARGLGMAANAAKRARAAEKAAEAATVAVEKLDERLDRALEGPRSVKGDRQ